MLLQCFPRTLQSQAAPLCNHSCNIIRCIHMMFTHLRRLSWCIRGIDGERMGLKLLVMDVSTPGTLIIIMSTLSTDHISHIAFSPVYRCKKNYLYLNQLTILQKPKFPTVPIRAGHSRFRGCFLCPALQIVSSVAQTATPKIFVVRLTSLRTDSNEDLKLSNYACMLCNKI